MKKLYVGNLPYDVTDDELSQLFTQCGQVASARIVKDRDSGRSKGFGFVEMVNDDEAASAISRMSGQDFHGRQLTVDEARERAGGGAGGGGGFRRGGSGGGGGGYRNGGGGEDRPRQGGGGYGRGRDDDY
ncbi:MAG: RNA-binding protein [Deltaproteobacteria bacterium]|nr:RNA-binding protein [Deltaproteobacteria bacterium]MBI3293679.1 RNA-binding protein [Deltaproteobacteria bacterium]